MPIYIPWPKGLSEEEKQKRIQERERKSKQAWQEGREALDRAVSEQDVLSLSGLALAAIQRMLRSHTHGVRSLDISDLSRITHELCVVGTAVLGKCPQLMSLATILKTAGDSLAGHPPGKSFATALAAASHEINYLHVVAEVARRTPQLPSPPQELTDDSSSPPGTKKAQQETQASHDAGQDSSDESATRSPKKSPTKRGSVSHDRDFEAVKLASEWDEEGRAWTQRDLAAALGLDRSQLFGTRRCGKPRCPVIAGYWEKRQREKLQRQQNMALHNRTGHDDGEE